MLAALAAAAAASTCTPVPGADRLWQSPATRFVMVGESHGTNEAPEMFGDLVCSVSKSRHVVVALEQPPDDQAAIDAFLASDGSSAARAQFLKARMWTMGDGRSSEAMLALFERLRQLKRSGRIAGVVAFQDYDLAVPFSNANEGINRGMAAALKRAAAANPGALVLAYGGSVHMSHDNVGGTAVLSAAGRLPRNETMSVFVDGEEGSIWNCQGATAAGMQCGRHPYLPQSQVCKTGVRQVVPVRDGQVLLRGYDAVACVGRPFTASPPAVPLTPK